MFCLLKRDKTMVGTPRKSLPSGRQMYNFFNSSWDPHIHGFCCLKTYQGKMYLVGKIIFHLPLGQLVLSSMLSGLRFEDLQTDKLYNPVKVSLNISHVNSTLTVSTRLIYSSQFNLSFSWQGVAWVTEKAASRTCLPPWASLLIQKLFPCLFAPISLCSLNLSNFSTCWVLHLPLFFHFICYGCWCLCACVWKCIYKI